MKKQKGIGIMETMFILMAATGLSVNGYQYFSSDDEPTVIVEEVSNVFADAKPELETK